MIWWEVDRYATHLIFDFHSDAEISKDEGKFFIAITQFTCCANCMNACNCVGPFAMSAEWANQLPVPDSVRQRSTVAHGFTAQRDRPLLSPAKFIPASSTSLTVSIRPPSKWSPVSSGGCHWSNKPSSKTSKSGFISCIVFHVFSCIGFSHSFENCHCQSLGCQKKVSM